MKYAEFYLHAMISHARPIKKEISPATIPIPIGLVKIWAAESCNVTMDELEGKARRRINVVARMIAAVYIKRTSLLSLAEIGALFGGKDHATIIHYVRNFDGLVSINDEQLLSKVANFNFLAQSSNEKYKLL